MFWIHCHLPVDDVEMLKTATITGKDLHCERYNTISDAVKMGVNPSDWRIFKLHFSDAVKELEEEGASKSFLKFHITYSSNSRCDYGARDHESCAHRICSNKAISCTSCTSRSSKFSISSSLRKTLSYSFRRLPVLVNRHCHALGRDDEIPRSHF